MRDGSDGEPLAHTAACETSLAAGALGQLDCRATEHTVGSHCRQLQEQEIKKLLKEEAEAKAGSKKDPMAELEEEKEKEGDGNEGT